MTDKWFFILRIGLPALALIVLMAGGHYHPAHGKMFRVPDGRVGRCVNFSYCDLRPTINVPALPQEVEAHIQERLSANVGWTRQTLVEQHANLRAWVTVWRWQLESIPDPQ